MLDGSLGTPRDGVLLAVVVQDDGVDTSVSKAGEDHHHTASANVIHIEEVVRHSPRKGNHITSSDDVVLDRAEASTHVVRATSSVVSSDGNDEVILVQTGHTVEGVTIEHGERLRDSELDTLSLSLPASHAGLHSGSLLVDDGEGGVGQVINVRPLIIIVLQSVRLSEEEVDLDSVIHTIEVHGQRQELSISDNDETVATNLDDIIHTLDFHGHVIDLQRDSLPGGSEGSHTSVVHSQSNEVVQITNLNVSHGVLRGLSSDITVDGGSGTGVGITISVNGHGLTGSEGNELRPVGEVVAVQLVLDSTL